MLAAWWAPFERKSPLVMEFLRIVQMFMTVSSGATCRADCCNAQMPWTRILQTVTHTSTVSQLNVPLPMDSPWVCTAASPEVHCVKPYPSADDRICMLMSPSGWHCERNPAAWINAYWWYSDMAHGRMYSKDMFMGRPHLDRTSPKVSS